MPAAIHGPAVICRACHWSLTSFRMGDTRGAFSKPVVVGVHIRGGARFERTYGKEVVRLIPAPLRGGHKYPHRHSLFSVIAAHAVIVAHAGNCARTGYPSAHRGPGLRSLASNGFATVVERLEVDVFSPSYTRFSSAGTGVFGEAITVYSVSSFLAFTGNDVVVARITPILVVNGGWQDSKPRNGDFENRMLLPVREEQQNPT